MTHAHALSKAREQSDCRGRLHFYQWGYWNDLKWALGRCDSCGEVIACVEGCAHWCNYAVRNPDLLWEAELILGT